ncbi:hypothetical protein HED60_20880 [Planctomycetales bacterium ZRK34]|nr:hypothetical protein HED60_20880 [Planctomycetales bacterium ZRK34]
MRMNKIIVAAAVCLSCSIASAATYTWDGGDGSSQAWSTDSNWAGDVGPVSASDTRLLFDGASNTGTTANKLTNDVADPFLLNILEFSNSNNVAFVLGGSQLQFVNDGSTSPLIKSTRQPQQTIYNPIEVGAGVTLKLQNTTYYIDFQGPISGDGALLVDSNFGSGEFFMQTANTFTGGTTYVSTTSNPSWRNLDIRHDQGLGAGDLNVQGGNINPYNASTNTRPGGVRFSGSNRTVSNDINLLADSPLYAGNENGDTPTSDNVTLSGALDLDTYTAVLRGRGTGTYSGLIDGSAGGGIKKLGISSTWNLTGTMLFDIDGATSSLIELDEGTLDISGLTIDFAGALATLEQYVLVDYATGGTLVKGSFNPFGSVANKPGGYAVFDDVVNSQILLIAVPTPGAGAMGIVLMLGTAACRRRR